MLLVGVWVFVVRSYTKNLNMEYVCPKNCWDPMIALEWIDLWQCCWMCDGLVMDTKSPFSVSPIPSLPPSWTLSSGPWSFPSLAWCQLWS